MKKHPTPQFTSGVFVEGRCVFGADRFGIIYDVNGNRVGRASEREDVGAPNKLILNPNGTLFSSHGTVLGTLINNIASDSFGKLKGNFKGPYGAECGALLLWLPETGDFAQNDIHLPAFEMVVVRSSRSLQVVPPKKQTPKLPKMDITTKIVLLFFVCGVLPIILLVAAIYLALTVPIWGGMMVVSWITTSRLVRRFAGAAPESSFLWDYVRRHFAIRRHAVSFAILFGVCLATVASTSLHSQRFGLGTDSQTDTLAYFGAVLFGLPISVLVSEQVGTKVALRQSKGARIERPANQQFVRRLFLISPVCLAVGLVIFAWKIHPLVQNLGQSRNVQLQNSSPQRSSRLPSTTPSNQTKHLFVDDQPASVETEHISTHASEYTKKPGSTWRVEANGAEFAVTYSKNYVQARPVWIPTLFIGPKVAIVNGEVVETWTEPKSGATIKVSAISGAASNLVSEHLREIERAIQKESTGGYSRVELEMESSRFSGGSILECTGTDSSRRKEDIRVLAIKDRGTRFTIETRYPSQSPTGWYRMMKFIMYSVKEW